MQSFNKSYWMTLCLMVGAYSSSTFASESVSCTIGNSNVWQSGFVLNQIEVTNNSGASIDEWQVQVQLGASDATVNNAWNATVTVENTIATASNKSYNGSLANGESTTFGFQGTYSDTWSEASCIVSETSNSSEQTESTTPTENNQEGNSDDGSTEQTASSTTVTYVVVDTMESECFDLDGEVIECGSELLGQDAEYLTTEASYQFYDEDETAVLDNNTGLIWQRSQSSEQYVFNDAADYCSSQTTAGINEWRLPTIKELYSLADFDGDMNNLIPYIDTRYFDFEYAAMAFATQFWSSNVYNVNVVGGAPDDDEAYVAAHGFNFADGHIKAYGTEDTQPGLYIRCVMGDEDVYGVNDYSLNDDGNIVTDNATGLMWQQADDGKTYEWTDALDYCENLTLGGYDDWRLPDNKELQSIVEYSKTEVPAIDTDFFDSTFNESYGGGDFDGDYGWYWTSTTLKDFPENASYIAFGRAYSTTSDDLTDSNNYHDWHGAGAQRSDPKDGVVEMDGDSCSITACDEERGANYVRCVRGNAVAADSSDYDDYVSSATASSTTEEGSLEEGMPEEGILEEGITDESGELTLPPMPM